KKIAYFGHIDRRRECGQDGQTVHSRTILSSLQRLFPDALVDATDSVMPFGAEKDHSFQIGMAASVRDADAAFLLVTPYFLTLFLEKIIAAEDVPKTVILCDGEWPLRYADEAPPLRNQLKRLRVILVETDRLQIQLTAKGFSNVRTLYNYRLFKAETLNAIRPRSKLCRCVVYSRVIPEKGVAEAAQAIRQYNKNADRPLTLDICGPLSRMDERWLDTQCVNGDPLIRYRGVLNPDTAILTLNEYDCLIFPTYFFMEGFPGTILEGLAAGLPIIATDWNLNGEILKDGENGYLVPIKRADIICEKLALLAGNDALVQHMSRENIKRCQDFNPAGAEKVLYEVLHELILS
ncbi:MAG: glycosyltransferase family 4 protein, partial [Oscillospiraceae bacterium]|nr:glycosyltransferase family 4 protein [Oscillospiraceae bacterium]